jgi:sugar phosphate isomerase/epimerase
LIALSTSWQSTLAPSGRDLIERLKALGFSEVELEYRITNQMFAELKSALASHRVRPVSIHNYFPMPEVTAQPGSQLWSFSADDPDERRTAVNFTKRSIDIAGEMGAKALVLHCGQVEIDPRMGELRRLFDAGQIEAPTGARVIGEIRRDREAKIGRTLDRVLGCLDSLVPSAQRAQVKLGLENRYNSHEIPNADDLAKLLPALGNGSVGYWHDVGHAAVQENLGLDSQAALLGRFRDRAIGVHLHDVNGYHDHLAPGSGDVDFSFIRENLPAKVIKVLEVQPGTSQADVLGSVETLAKAGIA